MAAVGMVEAAIAGRVDMHVSVEAIQEFVHHRVRRAAPSALEESRMLRQLCFLHPFDERVLDLALELIDSTSIQGRDAVHAATAMLAGFDQIVSVGPDFDGIPGLSRIGPAEWGRP